LQLAAESSVVAPALLLIAGVFWCIHAFRGSGGLPRQQNIDRAGVVSAVAVIVVHSFIDSDLYYFGVGLPFFMLLGLGLLLSADAVAPEFVPLPIRRVGSGILALVAVLFLYCGWVEQIRARVRGDLVMGNAAGAQAGAETLQSIAPLEPDGFYLAARMASNPQEALKLYGRAAELGPSARHLRAYARAQAAAGQTSEATTTLGRALQRDPNNLLALSQLLDLYRNMGDEAGAIKTAQQLVAVESAPYFKVRSLPQLVPTETYIARMYLAGRAADRDEKIRLLEPAVAGFRQYASATIPEVKRATATNPSAEYGGETLAKAQQTMNLASQAATQLAELYRAAGARDKAAAAEAEVAFFASALVK
jgi:tetratricopeptide (TPR) repeat protein